MSSGAEASAGQGKELGFWMSAALVVGNTIGMGIFLLPASLAPYGFNALVGWGITVAGVTVIARVFARLAQVFPESDGPYAYMRSTLGEWPAFLALWCYWISCWVTNAALAVGVVGYLGSAAPALAGVPPLVLALSLLWIFTGFNLLGTRTGGRVQVLTTALKLLPMAFVILLGAWLLVAEPEAYSRNPPTTPLTFGSMLAASTIALYAMLGVESAAVPAGRVRDAARTIPRATMAGTLLTAAVYVAVSAVAIILLPQEELAASGAPFADLLDRFVGTGSGRWLSVFVVVSGLGCLNGWVLLSGELSRTMASHRMLPSWLQASNRYRAPAAGLVATSTLATLMILMNYSKSLVDGFTFLTLVVTAAALPLYLCCALALVVLWNRGGSGRSAELLVLGALGCAYSVFAFVGMGREPFLWGMALAAAGIPLLVFLRRRGAAEVSRVR
ncbi:MAG: amino acid permease [Gammaproteobacteria bacterium]|nr:amino acid permease [Gammaproteobacteria bacterium]